MPALAKVHVPTQHGDTMRTGWNNEETSLTPSSVSSSFGFRAGIDLDEQIDAQPLLAWGQTVHNLETGETTVTDVVYVATENNSLYILDAASGKQLLHRNLGTPVPATVVSCSKNGSAHIGINSTPLLDLSTNTMYVMVYTYEGSPATPVYRMHAINMSTLTDKVSPVLVSASETLLDGSSYRFDATHTRQRSALLESGGTIYAAFTSYCDEPGSTRGWLMGWKAGSLTPLPVKDLTNRIGIKANTSYLTTIWMSGAGPAVDTNGDLFFVTGNSDKSGSIYNDDNNLSESVVRLSSNLSDVRDFFTPSDNPANPSGTGLKALEKIDGDLGSGGVLLLPTQSGTVPHLAAVAGKDGHLYLLNRDDLGGYNPGGANRVLGTYVVGACFCAPSYYVGGDGVARVVTSGGNSVRTWKLSTSGSPRLTAEYTSQGFANVQRPGFFTTISSNGKSGAVVWAVTRPASTSNPNLTLRAFDPAAGLKMIYSSDAGSWPNGLSNANTVPTVANGRVYVAAYKKLTIFGLRNE